MSHPFLACFAPQRRSTIGNRFGRVARRPGMWRADDVLAGVIEEATGRGDAALLDAIARYPEEALDYADAAHWRLQRLTAEERQWQKFADAVRFMKGPATPAQRGLLRRHGHDRAMTKGAATALIAELRGEIVPVRTPLFTLFRFVAPPPIDAARPPTPRPDFAHIPQMLRTLSGWLPWRYERRKGGEKWQKVPYDPATGRPARWGNPAVRRTYADAVAAFTKHEYDGVGVVLSAADRLVVIDLDHCLLDGWLTSEAKEILGMIDSYAETTPSGDGLHLWCMASLPGKGIARAGIELYGDRRFITVTGRRYADTSPAIAPAQGAVTALYARMGGAPADAAIAVVSAKEKATAPKIIAPVERTMKVVQDRSMPASLPLPHLLENGRAILAEVAPFLSDRIRGVAEGDRTVTKRDGTAYASDSNRIQAVLCGLLSLGLPDGDAIAAFLDTPLGRAEALERGEDIDRWLALSCRTARDWLANEPPTTPTEQYVRVDAAFLTARLKASTLAVAIVLASHAPNIFPSQATIAKMIGGSTGDVSNQLAVLQRLHLVTVVAHRGRQPVYALATTAAPPVRLPMAHFNRACRCGKDALAVLAHFAHGLTTQPALAAQLDVRPRRVAKAMRQLEGAGLLIGTPGMRNARAYRLAKEPTQSAHI